MQRILSSAQKMGFERRRQTSALNHIYKHGLRFVFVIFIALSWAADLPAASRQRPEATVTRTRSGVYKLYQRISGDTTLSEIGTEMFTIQNYKDNTMVIDVEQEMNYGLLAGSSESLRLNSHLEVEEESLFPRRYEMTKTSMGVDQELKIEMVANVAVIDYRLNKQQENHKRLLTNGTMIVDGLLLCQRWLLLQRFTAGFSGKLSMTVFNPVLKREVPAVLDYRGEKTATIRGETGTFKQYQLKISKNAEMRLYVDDSGMIVQADNGAQRFVLHDFKDETTPDPSGD